MEDSVGEEERREQGKTVPQAIAHQEVEAGGGGEPGEEAGFLSAVASKIGAAMSGTNGSAGEDGGVVNATAASNVEDKGKEDGNGGGGIFHKLMFSSPPASSPAPGVMETEEEKGEEKDRDAAGEQAGILSAMANKIGMAMSGANGNGNHSSEDDANMSNGDAVGGSKGEEKGDEENGGGILSAMANKIGMAMSSGNGEGNHGGSGDDAKTSNGEAVDGSKSEEEEKGDAANGGGLVDQIMSHLPSDDQAPDADEASLLIAIIED
uniref:Uncharacterized protein n=1 Tax=Arundo donax TaxID=35708 RepID=A0A0A8XRA9_ARUDO